MGDTEDYKRSADCLYVKADLVTALAKWFTFQNLAGLPWTDLGQMAAETYIFSLAYLENGICLAGTSENGKIFRSVDYGATWTDLGQQAAEMRVFSLAYLENGICLAGTGNNGKIFRSVDYGATWTDLGQQAAEIQVVSLAYLENGICLAGTGGNGKILRAPSPPGRYP